MKFPSRKAVQPFRLCLRPVAHLLTTVYLPTCTRAYVNTSRRLRARLANRHSDPLEGIEILRLRASRIDLFVRNFQSASTRKSHTESSIKRCRIRVRTTRRAVPGKKHLFITIAVNNKLACSGRVE